MSRNLLRSMLALALGLSLATGCSKDPNAGGKVDAGTPDPTLDAGTQDAGLPACTKDENCQANQKCDLATGTCVARTACTNDQACPAAEKCDVAAGYCVPRTACAYDDDCAPQERCDNEKGYCIAGDQCQNVPGEEHVTCRTLEYCNLEEGLGCRCVIADGATAPNNGFCKRRKPACAPCASDEECGNTDFFSTDLHEKGKCVAPAEGGQKYCLEIYRSSKCGCGRSLTVGDQTFCYPQDPGTCEDGAFMCCATDADCPAEHPMCDSATGRCRDVCTYDFANNETVGCRADLVCNVDPNYLDEASPNFGAGRCAPPCATDAECAMVGPGFKCLPEANSQPRCRPAGCLSDFECDDASEESPFQSHCQRSSGMCLCEGTPDSNCRCRPGTETDPLTGEAFKDCKPGFKCELEQCVKQNCVEQGGAELACAGDQFCCGDDRDGDGDNADDLCTGPDGASLSNFGECYDAPKPPWCALGCTQDADCTNVTGVTRFPTLCADIGAGPMCLYACERLTQCPNGFICGAYNVGCDLANPTTSCGPSGTCAQAGIDPMTGQPYGYCACTTPGQVGGVCPDQTICNDSGRWCIYTQACRPGPESCQ